MKSLTIVILILLLITIGQPMAIQAQAQPNEEEVCPAGYERGYVWTECFQYNGQGCYGIRDNGMGNTTVSCPQACCDDNYD
jgi:hypothetical protein